MRLVAATIRTTANNFLTIEFDARLAPYCEPKYPPRAIVIKNIQAKTNLNQGYLKPQCLQGQRSNLPQ